MRRSNAAVRKRLAGFDGNLPQVQLPQGLHGGLDMVFLAHRDATAGEHQVMAGSSLLQGLHRGVKLIGHDAQVGHLATQAAQHGTQEKAVGVVNGARRHLLGWHGAGQHQLVARGEQRHTRLAHHLQLGHAHAGGQAQRGGPQAGTRSQHHVATGHVLTRAADVLARQRRAVDLHTGRDRRIGRVHHRAFLLHHHRICPGGHRCAGEDAGNGAREQGRAHAAGRNALRHRQSALCSQHIVHTQGVAVHGAVVARWHLQARHNGLRQHAAIGITGRHGLKLGQGLHAGQQLG